MDFTWTCSFANTYISQFCDDTACCLEDDIKAKLMGEREAGNFVLTCYLCALNLNLKHFYLIHI